MEYTIQKLANLAGITTRTLRYYDEIGLLMPNRINSSGYRIYGEREVDRLQQILFYREMGMELFMIKETLDSDSFQQMTALKEHLQALEAKKVHLDLLIENVTKTINKEEGKITMSNNEKFIGFKKQLIEENEKKYGDEIRTSYGDETVNKSNAKLMNLSEEEYEKMQNMASEINSLLEEAVKSKEDPSGELGQKIARLHKEWLSFTWPSYSKEAHLGLAEMYVADERFTAYYDANVEGCAAFLKAAIASYIK